MFGITYEMLMQFFVRLLVLFTSMPVHECAHGLAADRLGDDTPRAQGRLTLNPFVHLDRTGSLLLFFTGFGWAKPVLVDTRNFKHPRRDMAIVSLAGPFSNILIATFGAVCYRVLLGVMPVTSSSFYALETILEAIIWINITLAVFNLLPVPPLDGSKILGAILPDKLYVFMLRYQSQISIVLILLLIFNLLNAPIGFLSYYLAYAIDRVTAPASMLFL